MLFNSITFIIFFSIVLFLHNLPLSWRAKKFNLLIASYLFYAAWNPPFVVLIWLSTLVDWFVVKKLHTTQNQAARKLLLLCSLSCNLGLLAFFKYGTFLLENFTALCATLGIPFTPAAPSIILPVGISFYTFQTLSYTIDAYRNHSKPWQSFLDFALFVTFFPQLVAGPIVRAKDFLPQCITPRKATLQQLSWGLSLLVIGLFNKVAIADGLLAPIVDKVYEDATGIDTLEAWVATLAFSGQIFCDFAGYSACAIGVALCLGFTIQDNFRFPYAAMGFSDFWRRWHISLSAWLRDYLYISLGGNQRGPARTQINLALTMLLGGLWHGAAWTFVVWGALHGAYLVLERILKNIIPQLRLWSTLPGHIILIGITYAATCIAWVFFRAQDFTTAFQLIQSMCGLQPDTTWSMVKNNEIAMVLAITLIMLSIHYTLRNHSLEHLANKCPWWLRSAILAAMLIAITTMSGDPRAFIYFQF